MMISSIDGKQDSERHLLKSLERMEYISGQQFKEGKQVGNIVGNKILRDIYWRV